MSISLRFAIRWLSYPLVFGSCTAFMVWALYAGIPYWPTTLIVSAAGMLLIAGLERIQPFRRAWLEDHQDTLTDLLHMLVNLSVIQFTAEFLAELGDAVPASIRLFPIESPLCAIATSRRRARFEPVCDAPHQPPRALVVALSQDPSQR
ncbi:hypothetical protein [Pseudomonas lopnurensis]|uniref:hypothetical protein n=1 Tax=Pseudomonas lopnurensis TaxID=1477517 RepID=UPI0028B15EDD|nr:hypothetical protein [Pseudomonas lopnurensis]